MLKTIFQWLNIEQKVPHWTSIRGWIQRNGLACLEEPLEPADDWIWLVDHSNQIGPEKVLVVLAVRAADLPPPGETIALEDMHLLAVEPATRWKREDMQAVYTRLANRHGAPREVLTDGAVELREGAECLKKRRKDTLLLRDFKHQAANELKRLAGGSERFNEFVSQVGRTRSSIQQTELAHLTPPAGKPKARFMNLQRMLDWAEMALWALDHPEAGLRSGVSDERCEEKLGWLRSFADELAVWSRCQRVVSQSVTFVNRQGLFRGASRQLWEQLDVSRSCRLTRKLTQRLLNFIREAEFQLEPGQRLWLSTEILESSFARYKQLEKQHCKSGFSSLLAAFGSLLRPATPATVGKAFSQIKVADVKLWVDNNLTNTHAARRQSAYREHRQSATTLTTTS